MATKKLEAKKPGVLKQTWNRVHIGSCRVAKKLTSPRWMHRFSSWVTKTYKRIIKFLRPYSKNGWMFALILFVLLAAQLTLLLNAQVGIYVNAAAFLALLFLALWRKKARQLAISAAILPVANMVCLSLPPSVSHIVALVVYYNVILVLAIIYRFAFTLEYPMELTKLGVKGYAFGVPLMLVIGQILGITGYVMLRHQYPFDHALSLAFTISASIVFAITEEMIFRGLIQQRGAQVLHPVMAAILSTLLYMTFSIGHVSYLFVIFALLAGAVLSAIYYFKQNLVLTITANAMMKVAYVGLIFTFILK